MSRVRRAASSAPDRRLFVIRREVKVAKVAGLLIVPVC